MDEAGCSMNSRSHSHSVNKSKQICDLFCSIVDLPTELRERALADSALDPEIIGKVRRYLELSDGAPDFLPAPSGILIYKAKGDRVGDFKLIDEIGRGGMGVVYLAEEVTLGRLVALKLLSSPLLAGDNGAQRFEREARIAAKLSHPSLVRIHRYGTHERFPFIAYEYIEGRDLAAEIDDRNAPLQDFREAARFIANIADALHHAHQSGIIHRDVKPSNILIDLKKRGYLTDFGLAKYELDDHLTRSGTLAGTFQYMSPEQVAASKTKIDYRTDIFSLGVVLYEMASNRAPFTGESGPEVFCAITDNDPAPLSSLVSGIPRDFETICYKALQKRPEDRFSTAADMAADLRRFAEGGEIKIRPPGYWAKLLGQIKKRRRQIGVAAGVVLALSVGGWLGYTQDKPPLGGLYLPAPSDSEVYALELDALSGEYGEPKYLGDGPMTVRLPSGFYRLVVRDSNGRFGEYSREFRPGVSDSVAQIKLSAQNDLAGMIRIPAGDFLGGMGGAYALQWPRQSYRTPGFLIGQFEVSNAQYRDYLKETGLEGPKHLQSGYDRKWDQFPVVGVTWYEARAYAEWSGARLATRLEWDRAARGVSAFKYPWGDDMRSDTDTCVERLVSKPEEHEWFVAYTRNACKVGSSKDDVSQAGLTDVLGNVTEWIDTPDTHVRNNQVEWLSGNRLARGAAWWHRLEIADIESILQAPASAPVQRYYIGIRLAKSVNPLPSENKKE